MPDITSRRPAPGGNSPSLASLVRNDSTVAGSSVKDALETLAGGGGGVSSVFGRVGGVIALLNDYNASLVNNDSSVTGATVKDALNNLFGLNAITKEPTGFSDNASIDVSYDETTRKVTLSGTFKLYYQGEVILNIAASSWVSDAHAVGPIAPLFLSYNGTAFVWSTTVWAFDVAQICFVSYDSGSNFLFALRETHGLMQHEVHQELHNVIGTYKTAGGTLSSYTVGAVGDRDPDVSATTLHDEDSQTINSALSTNLYTQYYLSGAGADPNFVEDDTIITPALVNNPYWNEFTGGTWQQTLMANNSHGSIWLIGVPTTSDTQSQKYRYVWVQGQTNTLSVAGQQALTPPDVDLGSLSSISAEFVFLSQVIIQYTANNWSIEEVIELSGTKVVQSASSSGTFLSTVSTDSTLTGDGTAGNVLGLNHFAYPSITLTTASVWTTVNGTWGFKRNLSDIWDRVSNITGPADLDEITYQRYLEAGTYSVDTRVSRGSGAGIMKVTIDGVDLLTVDTYTAVPAGIFNDPVTSSGAVATRGLKTIRVRVSGKNAASTGYGIAFYQIDIRRTA